MRKFRGDIYFAKFSLAFLFCGMLDFVSFPDVPLRVGRGWSVSPIPVLASLSLS